MLTIQIYNHNYSYNYKVKFLLLFVIENNFLGANNNTHAE